MKKGSRFIKPVVSNQSRIQWLYQGQEIDFKRMGVTTLMEDSCRH
jgi:hypothetical protein